MSGPDAAFDSSVTPQLEELPLPSEYSAPSIGGNTGTQSPADSQQLSLEPSREPELPSEQPTTSPANSIGSAFQCNSRAFSLDYSVESLGGTALADVELWGTDDGGRNWQLWGNDPDRESPFDVKVGDDGLFGFRMVIVGQNGQLSNRPRAGDNADVWINVDTVQPIGKITRALYGEGREDGMLVIDYTCTDSNLTRNPISLYYSTSLNGQWYSIASGLKNSELYIWKPPANLPEQIYLKMQAIDKAGNVGEYRLELPIDVKGLAPRGRIQRVRPIAP